MTDQAEAQVPQAAPPINDIQANHIKTTLIDNLHKAYRGFIESLTHFPGDVHNKTSAFLFFDTGLLWFERAITNLKFQAPPVASSQPETSEPSAPTDIPEEPADGA